MIRTLLVLTFMIADVFGASSFTYLKDGSVDSVNLDLSVSESARREDGAWVIRAAGEVEKRPVRLRLVVGDQWTSGEKPGIFTNIAIEILADGPESSALDEVVWRSFKREKSRTLFCSTYVGTTTTRREDVERKKIKLWVTDCGICGDLEIQVGVDLKAKVLRLAIFEGTVGRTYPDRVE